MVLWCFCLVFGWQNLARGSRSSTVACEAGQLDSCGRTSAGDTGPGTLAQGHWPMALLGQWTLTAGDSGHSLLGTVGTGPWQWTLTAGDRGCVWSTQAKGARIPAGPTPDSPGSLVFLWVCDAMLKRLELQPKQLMIEKEENGKTLKNGCVILQLYVTEFHHNCLDWLKESSNNFYENE